MEYSCLAWMNASPTTLKQLDLIQRKALKIIGVDEDLALQKYAISKLCHRRTIAATTVLFKMHTSNCPADLRALLPQAHTQVGSPGGYSQATPLKSQSQTLNALTGASSTLL